MIAIVLQILLALILVALNGLFVAAEFAFVRIRESTVQKLVDEKVKGSKSLEKVMERLDDYLAVTQLGITVSSLGLGWIGEPAFAALFEELLGQTLPAGSTHLIAFAIGFSIITFLHVVLGELVPKTLSIQLTEKISLFVAPIMRVFRVIFIPGIIVFNGTAVWITRMLGVPPAHETKEQHSEEEIRNIISSSTDQGLVDDSEHDMIRRVFEFDDTQLKEVMIPQPDVVTAEKNNTIREVQQRMNESNHTKLPISDPDNNSVSGMVDVRDTIATEDLDASISRIERDILVLPEMTSLDQALFKMKDDNAQIAAIVDEWGSFEGIVTVEDIVEEIVGELRDKFDDDDEQIKSLTDGTYLVNGTTNLRKVNETIGTELSSDDMDTISGWIMEKSSSIPSENSTIEHNNYEIHVIETDDNRIETIEIKRIKEE